MIASLTGLRALAAAWVVFNHFEEALLALFPVLEWARPIIGHGWLGVEVFFVLSGFVIAHNYAERLASPDRASVRSFWWARVARVYPVHLATLVVVLLMALAAGATGVSLNNATNYSVGNALGNLALLQALPPFHGVNWPAWSVSCEAAAYLLFPLLAVGLGRLSGRAALGWAASLLVVGVVAMQLLGLQEGTWSQLAYPVMWTRIAVEFAAGALLWVWWRQAAARGRRWDAVAVGCVAVVLVVLWLTGRDSPAVFLSLPFIALLVVAVASATGPVARVLSSRVFQFGGRVSYSLYMVHFAVFLVAKKLVGWERFGGASLTTRVAAAAAIALLIVGAACATYYLIEEPGRRLVRRWSGRRDRPGELVAAERAGGENVAAGNVSRVVPEDG